jgi:hypothetical protein
MQKPTRALLYGALLLLTACASDRVRSNPENGDPTQEMARVESDLQDASDRDIDVYSGQSFNQAQSDLDEAKNLRSSGGAVAEILKKLGEAQSQLAFAEKRARIARMALKETYDARASAMNANAGDLRAEALARAS